MSNPVLNENFVSTERILDSEPMSINGAVNKTAVLLGLAVITAAYSWSMVLHGFTDKAMMLMWAGAIGGFIAALIGIFSTAGAMRSGTAPKAIVWAAPVYALFEGLFLGTISSVVEAQYQGIVIQAVAATFAVLFVMLALFKSGAVKATDTFRRVIFTATLSVALIYLIQIIATHFVGHGIPQIFTASPIGIGFSLVVIAIAAFNFIIDFDFIERAAANLLPKNYEWYGAMGLMITLVWLYIEILRLLLKLNRR
ncbi:MAG: Bax inhibitor-1/YccA family protein [Heliobacteriaceae bacterium]|jgi:uncharacterized YccA/Bax inhibitor family protein|nr:Bax inhibitor-1/YccA family protein [Heliobacteriaceae bacterium]